MILLLSVDNINFPSQGTEKQANGESTVSARLLGASRERKIKSKYDLELAAIDAADENNWEIHSENRQRALYHNLYSELDVLGKTKDHHLVYEVKLNKLCPGGDFKSFVSEIRRERIAAKNKILADIRVEIISVEDLNGDEKEVRQAIIAVNTHRVDEDGDETDDVDDEVSEKAMMEILESTVPLSPSEIIARDRELGAEDSDESSVESMVLPLLRGARSPPVRDRSRSPSHLNQTSTSSQARTRNASRVDGVSRRLSSAGTFTSKLRDMSFAAIKTNDFGGKRKMTSNSQKMLSKSMPQLPSKQLTSLPSIGAQAESTTELVRDTGNRSPRAILASTEEDVLSPLPLKKSSRAPTISPYLNPPTVQMPSPKHREREDGAETAFLTTSNQDRYLLHNFFACYCRVVVNFVFVTPMISLQILQNGSRCNGKI